MGQVNMLSASLFDINVVDLASDGDHYLSYLLQCDVNLDTPLSFTVSLAPILRNHRFLHLLLPPFRLQESWSWWRTNTYCATLRVPLL